MKYFAGIGSRATPPRVLDVMTAIARKLKGLEWTLRSGGAGGADQAFEAGFGSRGPKEIFYADDATVQCIQLASKYHPAWDKCSNYAKKLHGRNMMILLGRMLDTPVKFVVCYTEGAQIKGGTGQALRYAKENGIPITNLGDPDVLKKVKEWVSS